MKVKWQVDKRDAKKVRAFYRQYESDPFVQERKKRNVVNPPKLIRKAKFWEKMVGCLLSSQQRSGPGSAVDTFVKQRPFPLPYNLCRDKGNVRSNCARAIRQFGRIRFGQRVSGFIEANFRYLENEDGWQKVIGKINELCRHRNRDRERETARLISKILKGIGPKQSRNLLQELGVTQQETPLDSRITKWLNKSGFPVHLNAKALLDESCYCFVLDGFQELCRASGILPCLMDAAIFISYNRK